MKKIIYINGIICVNLILFGAFFKIVHYPGAAVLLTLGFTIFGLAFVPTALYNNYKNSEGLKSPVFYIITGFVIDFILMGMLFKIQHYPGAGLFLMISIPLPFLLFLPAYLIYYKKQQPKSIKSFLAVVLFLIYFVTFSSMLSLNVSKNILNAFTNIENTEATNVKYFTDKNEMLYSGLKDDKLALELKNKTNELTNFIKDLKLEIVNYTEFGVKDRNEFVLKNNYDFSQIKEKDNYDKPMEILIGYSEDAANGKARELKNKLNIYKSFIFSVLKDNNQKLLVKSLINTDDKYDANYGENLSWEINNFFHSTIVSDLSTLTSIEGNIKFIEWQALNSLKK